MRIAASSAALALAVAFSAPCFAQAVDELSLVSRPPGVGTNVNRAKVDKRALAAGRMKELMTPYIKSEAAPSSSRRRRIRSSPRRCRTASASPARGSPARAST